MKILIALLISFKSHFKQFDKGGNWYILHPLRIFFKVKGKKEKIVALLHDVIEDSNTSLKSLEKYFDKDILIAIDCITRKKDQDYFEYLENVKNNPIAKIVKIEDLKDNMNLNRLKKITKNDLDRNKKYNRALEYLL